MGSETKCGTGCVTPSVCHAFFCNRVVQDKVLPTPTPTADGEADAITPSMVARAAGATDCSPSAMAEHLSGQFRALRARPALPADVQAVVELVDSDVEWFARRGARDIEPSRVDVSRADLRTLLAHLQRDTRPAPVVTEAMVDRVLDAMWERKFGNEPIAERVRWVLETALAATRGEA